MNTKENVIRTFEFNNPKRIPVQSFATMDVEYKYGKKITNEINKYAFDFYYPKYTNNILGLKRFEKGMYIDGWGSVWHNKKRGTIGEVKEPAITNLSEVKSYKAPKNLIREGADKVDDSIRENKEKFILTPWAVDIFERMQHLRTTVELYIDLMEQKKELFILRDIVFDFYLEWVKFWIAKDIDGIVFADDWGSQNALLISPEIFRNIFKPMYKELIDMAKAKGKYIFFHSDGNIKEIYDDLIEIGVDAINSQLWLMGIEKMAQKYTGRITFWGELDRQTTLPFGKPKDIIKQSNLMKDILRKNDGGLIGVCAPDNSCSYENIIAGFKCWND